MVYSAFRDENDVPVAIGVSTASASLVLPFKISAVTGRLLTDSASGSGTVTDVSVVTANGFAGTVANSTTTPAITLTTTITGILSGNGTAISAASTTGTGAVVLANSPTLVTPVLGAATATSINGLTITSSTGTLTISNGKVVTHTATTAFAGTDGKTLTVSNSGTLAGGDGFTLAIAAGKTLTASNSGTLAGGDAFVLAIAAGKTLTVSNTLTFTGTDASSVAFGTGGTVLYTASAIPLTVGTTTIASGTNTRILYDNSGVLGEYTLTGTGTAVVMANTPTLITPVLGVATATSVNGLVITTTTGTLTMTNGKTLTVSDSTTLATNAITLGGGEVVTFSASNALSLLTTGSTVMTFPAATDTVVTLAASQTLTSKTLTSPIIQTSPVLAAATNLKYTVASSDGTATGDITNEFNSGYSSTAIGDLVYLDSSATWQKADADASAATYSSMLGIALSVTASASPATVLLRGFVYAATPFPTFTIGAPIYMSATAGAVTQTAPVTTDSATRLVGYGVHADKMWFCPSNDWITHT